MPSIEDAEIPFVDFADDSVMAAAAFGRSAGALRRLRRESWVIRTPYYYAVLDHDVVKDLQRDQRLRLMGVSLLEAQGITDGYLHETFSRSLLSRTGEEHARLRRLVTPAFSPRSVNRFRPGMRRHLLESLERLGPEGHFDWAEDLAATYPVAVICEAVGAPPADHVRIAAWADIIFQQFSLLAAERAPQIEQATREMSEYVAALAQSRRAQPADDLLSVLLAQEEAGNRLSVQDIVDLVLTLLIGGVHTVRNQLGLAAMLFLAHPDQWDLLAERPDLAERAADEVLRFQPTTPTNLRIVEEEIEVRGFTFAPGTLIALVVAAANRDPARVARPHRFDVSADRGEWQHLTFGNGPHYCLGAHLARAELEEAFTLLPPALRDLRPDGEPEMRSMLEVFGPVHLPVRFRYVPPPADG